MTELEYCAKLTLEKNGIWAKLEQSDAASLHMAKSVYCDGRDYSYSTPVYQVYDAAGNNLFSSTDYIAAVRYFDKVS